MKRSIRSSVLSNGMTPGATVFTAIFGAQALARHRVSITTPAFVRYSRKNMEEGARKAGKDPGSLVLGSVIVGSIGRNSAQGKEGAREQAAMYLANKVQNIKG